MKVLDWIEIGIPIASLISYLLVRRIVIDLQDDSEIANIASGCTEIKKYAYATIYLFFVFFPLLFSGFVLH